MSGSDVAPDDLMLEMPDAGENHSHAVFVRSLDDLWILEGPARLDEGTDASLGSHIDAIPKWEKCVRGQDTALDGQPGFRDANLCGIYTAHLSGADAHGLTFAGINDRIRLDMLHDFPGRPQCD